MRNRNHHHKTHPDDKWGMVTFFVIVVLILGSMIYAKHRPCHIPDPPAARSSR